MKWIVFFLSVIFAFSTEAQKVDFSKPQDEVCDIHIVAEGETLYALSKKYQTTVTELLRLNPDIINNSLPLAKAIKVPVMKSEAGNSVPGKKKENAIFHIVGKGETVYSISRKYDTSIETILMWNDLKEPAINEGQRLIVGYNPPKMDVVGPLPMEDLQESKAELPNETGSLQQEKSVSENVEESTASEMDIKDEWVTHQEKGIATWTHSYYDDGNFYALHPAAPKGTEITVKNLMNDKTVKVKVIGRLPATSENENVTIKISESAARMLNVLDEKFLVELSYLAPDSPEVSETN